MAQGRLFAVLTGSILAAMWGCSDDLGDAEQAATSGGGQSLPCAAAYCLEADIRIVTEPLALVFSDIAVGEEEFLKLRVRNIGASGELSLTAVSFAPPSPAFAVVNFAPAQVAKGQWVDWQVRYKPVDSKVVPELKLRIANNSSNIDERLHAVPVQVKAASGALSIKPDPIDFGTVTSGSTETRKVKLFNTGEHPLKIVSAELASSGSPTFKITAFPDYAGAIAPSASDELTISFKPDLGGSYSSQLMVTDSTGALSTVHVFGEEDAPVISVIPPTLNYGAMKSGDKSSRTFKILNNGSAPLQVSEVLLAGDSLFKNLLFSDGGPFTIEAGGSRSVDVTLTADKEPPASVTTVATVEVHSNAANTDVATVPVKVVAEPCDASQSSITVEATEVKGATDIIWIVDTSGSMKAEAQAVQMGVNAFAQFIGSKAIDYHVVMLAKTSGICVPPPLAAAACSDSAAFKHVNVDIGSKDGLQKIIESYPQWQGFLREGATRHFVMVTDDNSKEDAKWFKGKIAGLAAPGFPTGFTFHSIIATGATPAETIPFIGCIGGAGHGTVYEELSSTTGGVIQSICGLSNWAKVFNAIASKVAASVKVLKCNYSLPAGDPTKVAMTFVNSSGQPVTVKRVDSEASCPANAHGWYFDNNAAPTKAVLCPITCTANEGQKLQLVYGC